MAVISSLGMLPTHLSANARRRGRPRIARSETTGPKGDSRTVTVRSTPQRTRMRSRRSAIDCLGKSETSNKSLLAACKFVPPQAIFGLRPDATNGKPGIINPTTWKEGDLYPAMRNGLGSITGR